MVWIGSSDFVGCGAAIKRRSRAERKRERALCPIHTTRCVNPDQAAHCRLTGFPGERGDHRKKNREGQEQAEPFAARAHSSRRRKASGCLSAESNQDEIDQRNQGSADAGGDQGIVGADVGLRIERCLVGFSGHFGGLGRAGRSFCELGHIRPIFFAASSSERVDVIRVGKTRPAVSLDKTGQGQAMGQQVGQWRSGEGQKLWLSMLVDTMEAISRSKLRGSPVSPSVLRAMEAHLARPASAFAPSSFSLRN
jgi:hypothetical protein